MVSVPHECSVADALHAISAQFGPTLAERLVTAEGTAQRSVLLFVNDLSIAHALAARHLLKAGDAASPFFASCQSWASACVVVDCDGSLVDWRIAEFH